MVSDKGKVAMDKRILVLVSTYNGERYLAQQLKSILGQLGVQVSIIVRDDGSKDGTIAILEKYSSNFPNVSYYQGKNVGPCMSFFDLLRHADGFDYYAFCDQDDVWDNDKLLNAVGKLSQQPNDIPVLYCSNLKVVDESLNYCRKAHKKNFNTNNMYSGLVDFYAVGCTEVFNQKAVDITRAHVRKDCMMHDSWMFMICNFFGCVIYDHEAYINYRQHGHNVVGTNKDSWGKLKARIERATDRKVQPRLKNAMILADEFGSEFEERDFKKIAKIVNYKKGFLNWMNLLFDFSIRSSHIGSDIRYRMLLLLREI